MAVETALPTLGIVVTTAIVDSINPCAIGVLIVLLSALLVLRESKKRMIIFGITYIAAVFVAYLLAGLGLIFFLQRIPLAIAEYISIAVASLLMVAGLLEIKDFFWYGRWFSLSISGANAKRIERYAKRISLPSLIFLGFFVAAVELPCTGGPYLAITLLLSQSFNATAFAMLVLYNIIFIIPLVAILAVVMLGARVDVVKKWKQRTKAYMRLATGLILIVLSWLLILIANGTINFG
ncbi:MAG: hypothetical protein HYT70_04665 [Candidatus Aenigmarchaeota archaeon]|nr:hypothetical protein [Candidatus Aenigmarchaeota archaeon]